MVLRRLNYVDGCEYFSNRTVVDFRILDTVGELIEGGLPTKESMLSFDKLVHAIALSEEVVVHDGGGFFSHGLDPADWDNLQRAEAVSPLQDAIAYTGAYYDGIAQDLDLLATPWEIGEIAQIHDGDIILKGRRWSSQEERDELGIDSEDFDPYPIGELDRALGDSPVEIWKHEPYVDISRDGYYSDPIAFVCRCRGISYVHDQGDQRYASTYTIGEDLYKRLCEENSGYFERIRKHLGPSVVQLPPLSSIVLGRCELPEQLPDRILSLRDELSPLRQAITKFNLSLRLAENLHDQVEILKAIDESFTAHSKKWSAPDRKIVYRAYDIIKKGEAKSILLAFLEKLIDFDVERESLLRLQGLSELHGQWMASPIGLSSIERLWGASAAKSLGQN